MPCLFYILKPQDATIWSLFYTLFFKVVQYIWILRSMNEMLKFTGFLEYFRRVLVFQFLLESLGDVGTL